MDMDMEPFCAHPKTLLQMPYGSNLSRPSASRKHCGTLLKSWEERPAVNIPAIDGVEPA